MSFELSYFGKCSVFLEAAHINSMALEKSHITQKDNHLLVGERSCVCVCAFEHLGEIEVLTLTQAPFTVELCRNAVTWNMSQ